MTRDDHLMGKKLRDHYQKSLREHVSAPTSAFAKAQLEKMGWSEGTGLGKRRDGRAEHIRVTRRQEQLGLGSSSVPEVVQAVGQHEWWKDSLGKTLAKLESKKKAKKSKKKDKTDSKGKEKKQKREKKIHYTDEELFEATGGARFGMRAGVTKNLHKWTRTERLQVESDSNNQSNAKTEDSGNTCRKARKRPLEKDINESSADSFSKEENDKEQPVDLESSEKSKKEKKRSKEGKKNKRTKGQDDNTSLSNEGTSSKDSSEQQSDAIATGFSEAEVTEKDLKRKRKAAKKERKRQKKQRL